MTPATRTVKNGSGKSPAWPTVFRTSSSEMLVSASWMVLNIRGRWEVTISCNDMSRLVEGRHLLRKMELGTKDRTLQIDKTANATRTRTQVCIAVKLFFTRRGYLPELFLWTECRELRLVADDIDVSSILSQKSEGSRIPDLICRPAYQICDRSDASDWDDTDYRASLWESSKRRTK